MVYPTIDIASLTVGERLGLIEQVWYSLRRDAGDLALNEDERALIEVRRAEHRADPDSTVGWDAVRAELLNDQDADDRQNSSAPRRGRRAQSTSSVSEDHSATGPSVWASWPTRAGPRW